MLGTINGSKFDIAIPHRNWQRALMDAFAILSCASPGDVVCITGPSRAGKSLLIERLAELLFGSIDFEKTGKMPAIVADAENTGAHGAFSTKSFILQMLREAKHPMYSVNGFDIDDMLTLQKIDKTTETTLRFALESALKSRGVKIIFIDEAQHVKYASKDAQAAFAVMDSWKCLAKKTGTVMVFVGAYPLLDVIANSPHLLGRKHQVHLPRYRATEEDLHSFAALLEEYSVLLNLDDSIGSLVDEAELMFFGSLGCIGLLKNWLKRADAQATIKNIKISRKLLLETRLSDSDLEEILTEINVGEARLAARSNEFIPPSKGGVTKITKSQKKSTQGESSSAPAKKSKPFQKKPVRRKQGNRV
ncbi:AAA family ATPase [Aurantivibrio plasticivorans]